jgi:cation diffusion facilitator CzcD-associated flavoprotein CzcO
LAAPRGNDPINIVTTVVIGAGHAGLAMSRSLADRAIDHVVLERGEVAPRGGPSGGTLYDC